MVICFLIHTVSPVSALSAGESRILYARVFGPETGDGDFTPEQRRLMQKEKLHLVARCDEFTIVNHFREILTANQPNNCKLLQ